jgi:pSer/pThr/pTyr-binding forkhead associated (FHA) protein
MSVPVEISGARGVFAGVRVDLKPGDRLTVGRSRFVDVSAAKTPMALKIGRDRLEKNDGFRRMSRRHFEISYEAAGIVVTDLSRNGIILDGRRIKVSALLDPAALADGGVSLRFGAGEELRVRVRTTAPAQTA